MKITILALALFTFSGLFLGLKAQSGQVTNMNKIQYPDTKKGTTIDEYWGQKVADPYRWLEDDRSPETEAWVNAQNAVTNAYLSQIPFRDKIKDRLTKLWNYEKMGAPFVEGDYTYFYKNDGLQNQYVLYRKDKSGNTEVFLDPNTFSEDGTVSLGGLSFTKDGSLCAYTISEGGSDWRKGIIMDAKTKQILEDTLVDLKFTGLSWYKNEGLYYSSYDKPEGSELSAKTDQHKLYYHKLGTSQSDDMVIYGGSESQKRRYVGGYVTEDQRYLVISGSNTTSGNELAIMDLEGDRKLITITADDKGDSYVADTEGETIFIKTNLDAPNGRLVKTSLSSPAPDNWQDVIPNRDMVMSLSTGSGYFFAEYMKDATSLVEQYDMSGNKIRDIKLPGIGSAGGFGGKKEQKTLYYSFTNYHTPGVLYSFDPASGKSEAYWSPKTEFEKDQFTSEQVFYTSKDGTKVPMIISYKKGINLDGNNPTLLYGYGGFNISLTPGFSITRAVWMEMGGILAIPNLRGGGEYGKEWHDAGTQMKKQNVFDDFIAAAEYLIKRNYTSSEKLIIQGGSNGGLLVGACMTQRPELFQVALPAVGVMDMLRYNKFTAGAGWSYDYGTAEDSKEMFEYLKKYSPLHAIKKGVSYPATLVTTADHDDRVVPAHSFKFAATLQEANEGDNPVLIRIEKDAGHGAGTPLSKTIEQYSDLWSFALYNVGLKDVSY